jgi:IPT/TIG domain
MRSCLVNRCKRLLLIRVALIIALTLLLSGWTTCNALFVFNSCQGSVPQPQITSLSPDTIPDDAGSVLLVVNGSAFVPQSQIMWNGSALQTTFMNPRHLQTTITQEIFDSFGGSTGSNVQISVRSLGSVADLGCPIGGNSTTLVLVIN